MSLTTDRIEPTMLAAILKEAEPVIVDTESGWQFGRRSQGIYTMFNCMGRITVTEKDEVYHSMVGSRPTYSRVEMVAKIDEIRTRLAAMDAALTLLDPL